MSFLTVLSLSDAKNYLKVEHSDTDVEITAMINAAGSYLERVTNHILVAKDETYELSGMDCIRIYDYPINSVVKGIDSDGADVTLTSTDYGRTDKTLYSYFGNIDVDAKKLVLNVGYVDPADIPNDIKECMKIIVKSMYYSHDAESIDKAIPVYCKEIINSLKRFII